MKLLKFLAFICVFSVSSLASAQVKDKGKEKEDSLALVLDFNDRIAFRTNFVDWVLTTPNIGVEIDLGNKTYNHWTVGFNVRGNWNTSHTFNPGVVYNISGARADVRYYYRMRKIGGYGNVAGEGAGVYPPAPKGLLNKLFSCRREEPKHPDITYYRGLYASYNKFSIKLGNEGKQGSAFTLGFTWGFIKPLYVFENGNSMDLEMGISAGVAYAQYDKYKHDRESNCYPVVGTEDWGVVPHPVLSDLRVGLVYRLGNTTVKEKYAWRYDVDQAYRDSLNKMMTDKNNERIRKETWDAGYGGIDSLFKGVYVIHEGINKIAADSTEEAQKAAAKKAKELEKEKKAAMKAAEAQAKKDAKAKAKEDAKAKKEAEAAEKQQLKEAAKAQKEADAKEKADAKIRAAEEAKAQKEADAAEKQRLKDAARAKKETDAKAKADAKAQEKAEKERKKAEEKARKEAEKNDNEEKEADNE